MYLWVDGIHLEVRLEQDKVCLLVMIGARADGTKEVAAARSFVAEYATKWPKAVAKLTDDLDVLLEC